METNAHEIVKGKPLSKQETEALLGLIENSRIITTKTTNATNNKLKKQEWTRLAEQFNATSTNTPRTSQQLRLKWENLKKNSRKRSTQIRMSQLKTGGGPPDYIPPDDILDRVTGLLGSTVTGFTVPFGGDREPEVFREDDGTGTTAGDGSGEARVMLPDLEEVPIVISNPNNNVNDCQQTLQVTDLCLTPVNNNSMSRLTFNNLRTVKKTKKDDGRAARNHALVEYFASKKLYIDAKINNIHLNKENLKLQNRKLCLENEKYSLEIQKLKLELDQLKNCSK